VADVEKIGAELEMGAVFFHDAEGQETSACGLLNGGAKVGGGEFFPFGGEFGLCVDGRGSKERSRREKMSARFTLRCLLGFVSCGGLQFSPRPRLGVEDLPAQFRMRA
jgi:hypothetical protein